MPRVTQREYGRSFPSSRIHSLLDRRAGKSKRSADGQEVLRSHYGHLDLCQQLFICLTANFVDNTGLRPVDLEFVPFDVAHTGNNIADGTAAEEVDRHREVRWHHHRQRVQRDEGGGGCSEQATSVAGWRGYFALRIPWGSRCSASLEI